MISKRVLVVAVCVAVLMVAVGAYGYALYSEISSLKGQISLLNQELEELWEELNALEPSNSTNNTMNFTFTWGPGTQKIVQGTLRLEISLTLGVVPNSTNKWLFMVVRINDDEYNPWDYLGIVFDMNENGVIDPGSEDEPFGLWANNMTAPSLLFGNFLAFAETMPTLGPHNCTFDPDTGYTFYIFFPTHHWPYSPHPENVLKEEYENPLHICFEDSGGGRVFVRFSFYIPEST